MPFPYRVLQHFKSYLYQWGSSPDLWLACVLFHSFNLCSIGKTDAPDLARKYVGVSFASSAKGMTTYLFLLSNGLLSTIRCNIS